jgi:protein-tyrosine phosphatase
VFGNPFATPEAPPGPPTLTFICTGNICRSALAEKLLAERLAASGVLPDLTITSAGLHAVVGSPMDTMPALIAERHGADPAHAGTQVSRELIESSSLILTMTRAQLDELVVQYPTAMRRAFTLTEFVRLLTEHPDEVPPSDAASGRSVFDVAMDASRHRSLVSRGASGDIDDPYRRSEQVHERVGSEIVSLVGTLAGALAR